jgi:predicted acyltransferase (DUF342 family)
MERAMKKIILIGALLFGAAAHAQLVENPLLIPSTSLTVGDCVQATGPNSVATVAGPCGTGGGGSGTVTGPTASTTNDISAWANGTGTALLDTGIQYTNIGLLGSSQMWNGTNTFTLPATFSGQHGAIDITGASSTFRGINLQTLGVNRWGWGANVDPESGSNSGSDLTLQAYSDTGTAISDPIRVFRSSGVTQFSVDPTVDGSPVWYQGNLPNPAVTIGNNTFTGTNAFNGATSFSVDPTVAGSPIWYGGNFNPALYAPLASPTFTSDLTVNGPYLTVSGASGTYQRYTTNTIGTASYPTWEWGTDGTAQTGSNAGSNFGLYAFSDTGTYLSEPIAITRSTGAIAFGSDPTAPTPANGTNSTALATTQYVQSALTGGITSPIFGNVSVGGQLAAVSAATFGSTLSVAGASTLAGPVSVNGNLSSSTLTENGIATFGSNITVAGTSTFSGNMSATSISASGANYFGALDVTGDTTLGTTNNTTQVEGTLNVSGGVNIDGNSTIGKSSDVITVNSYLNVTGPVTIQNYTVSTLPSGSVGMRASVADAVTCGFNVYVSGGGSIFCPVIFNGSGWVGG